MADVTRLEQFLNHIAHPEDPVPAPQTRMEQNLLEIAENKGGGGELPAVTAEDNDKVLAVVNGAWDKAEASGGGGGDMMVIKVTLDQSTGTPTADKTYNEVFAALSNGTTVMMIAEGLYFTFTELVGSGENISIKFTSVRVLTAINTLSAFEVTLNNDDSVEISGQYEYSLTPKT